MKLLRIVSLLIVTLGYSVDVSSADEPAAILARTDAEGAENNAMSWRFHAESMRDDAENLKTQAQALRGQCVTANATQNQLDPGDGSIQYGNSAKSSGQSIYSLGSALDAEAQDFMVFAGAYFIASNWGDATASYNQAKIKFNDAADDYEEATTGGFYEAYESYDAARSLFDVLLMELTM